MSPAPIRAPGEPRSGDVTAAGARSGIAGTTKSPLSRWFFPGVAAALLTAVLAGFAPSFYLRPLFADRPLPGYLYVHGTVLTAWFVLVFAQTWFVAVHRTSTHRRVGVAAAAVAGLLVPISAFVAVRAIPRYVAGGVDAAEIQFIVLGDLVSLAVFAALVVAALRLRRRPDWHKRLMAVACIIIIGPAIARLERVGLGVPVPAVLVLLLVLCAGFDLLTLRRIHRATAWGSLLVVVALGAILALVGTAAGQAMIDRLRTAP